MLDDIRDYIRGGKYEDAGIALGVWFKESILDDFDEISPELLEDLANGFEGEIVL